MCVECLCLELLRVGGGKSEIVIKDYYKVQNGHFCFLYVFKREFFVENYVKMGQSENLTAH